MKKSLIVLCMLSFCNSILAENINDIIDIKYRWYKEEKTEELYYPKGDDLEGYLENSLIVKYGNYTDWDSKYCNYSSDKYLIEEKEITNYDKLVNTKYIRIKTDIKHNCNINNCFNDIKVFSGKNSIDYNLISNEPTMKILELYQEIAIDDLWFYISSNVNYMLFATDDIKKTLNNLGYGLPPSENGVILTPFSNWILSSARYHKEETEKEVLPSAFIKNIVKKKVCRVREINTYRYKINKLYYDEKYHTFVEGYIPDINNYYVTYNDSYRNKDIENTNKYIPLNEENEGNITEASTDTKLTSSEHEKVIYKTKYIDRVTNTTSLKIYLILIFLIIIIIIQSCILLKKKVD